MGSEGMDRVSDMSRGRVGRCGCLGGCCFFLKWDVGKKEGFGLEMGWGCYNTVYQIWTQY